jgi:hypothetical protein
MGKLVVVHPGEVPRLVEHAGIVRLETMHHHIHTDCVGHIWLGRMPSGRHADVWFDDEGLLAVGSIPNRRIGPDTIIVGSLLVCARSEDADSVALSQDEAEAVVALIQGKWPMLAPDHPKPEPSFRVTRL